MEAQVVQAVEVEVNHRDHQDTYHSRVHYQQRRQAYSLCELIRNCWRNQWHFQDTLKTGELGGYDFRHGLLELTNSLIIVFVQLKIEDIR